MEEVNNNMNTTKERLLKIIDEIPEKKIWKSEFQSFGWS